jgi:hypothetical protein
MNDDNYDVVADALLKYKHMLWKMTEQNMNADMFNAMDQIRLDQIDQLDKAIKERKQPKRTWVGLTDEEVEKLDCVQVIWQDEGEVEICGVKEFYRNIEARLKEKNR